MFVNSFPGTELLGNRNRLQLGWSLAWDQYLSVIADHRGDQQSHSRQHGDCVVINAAIGNHHETLKTLQNSIKLC